MTAPCPADTATARRILLLGATGTIGRATARALLARGHDVICVLRPRPGGDALHGLPEAARIRLAEVTDPVALRRDGIAGARFDAVVSCMASRSGAPADAWAIDHRAHLTAMAAAREAGARQMVLLSAICVQKPRLAFQHAKLAFEAALAGSGMTYSIVRPTAYFKSLSGQIARVRAGRPYLIFGDGRLTACKPIGDDDLAGYLADCLEDRTRWNRILPIGGPGPALTPRDQAEEIFRLLGQRPRFRRVPVAMLDMIAGGLALGGRLSPGLRGKAELARIGRYYATESMLVLDPATGRYAADATPETGSETLFGHYSRIVEGRAEVERGAHSVF